jgi:aspartyl/asparaginyl-tRNA synthetase
MRDRSPTASSPPQSWGDPDRHFREAITSPWYKAVVTLMGEICFSTSDFFRQEGFWPAITPVTTGAASSPMGLGSDSLPVKISLFDTDVYLADSMQFHLEYLLRQGWKGVFYIMPTFRGEDSSNRHLNQFFHAEAEMVGYLDDVMDVVERYVRWCTDAILRGHGELVKDVAGAVDHLTALLDPARKIPRVTFAEARGLLGTSSEHFTFHRAEPVGLSRSGEQKLMGHHGGVVWVTRLPALGVPFYQAAEGDTALCADLLLGVGETVGCGQRHVSYEDTLRTMSLHGVDTEPYGWYLRMKREHPLQTSGFGLGLERFILWVLKHDDIRDVSLFVRLKGSRSSP